MIDLFAGPGGLGEGFSAFADSRGQCPFRIVASVEKEPSAHSTLQLRAFFRQFGGEIPQAYYKFVRGRITPEDLQARYPHQAQAAARETLYGPRQLGDTTDDELVFGELKRLRRQIAEEFIVIGGPPCQAYSIAGRARNRGVKGYRPEADRRHYLYQEYLRVLDLIRPAVFVMENVRGILSSKIKDQLLFPTILRDLAHPSVAAGNIKGPRYRIYSLATAVPDDLDQASGENFIIKSELYGVPQSRHRVILLGVREDIARRPAQLAAEQDILPLADVIGGMPQLRSGLSREPDSAAGWQRAVAQAAAYVKPDLRRAGVPADDIAEALAKATRHISRGSAYVRAYQKRLKAVRLRDWLEDRAIGGYLHHETREHIRSDLARYFFCACYGASAGLSPRSHVFPDKLAPRHRNWYTGAFADRFKVQVADRPSGTITSHIARDGHHFIHYDPSQCRSLTVREAARVQTFPDNYFFCGNRTQQYTQVGNAVPPWLSRQIAEVVAMLL
ncbi:MAG TPA: DNA (cytosine-5-)-methyltransferase [Acidobacteriaceae bacterium]|nr:DNA (cytosine-5-)-methyltransferase [Acidobacteriaceae bacterium]